MGWPSGGGGCEGSPPAGGALGVEDEAVDLVLSEPAHRLAGYVGVEFHAIAAWRMVGAFAEFERAMLKERTKAGLDAARKAGRIGGRPPKLKPH